MAKKSRAQKLAEYAKGQETKRLNKEKRAAEAERREREGGAVEHGRENVAPEPGKGKRALANEAKKAATMVEPPAATGRVTRRAVKAIEEVEAKRANAGEATLQALDAEERAAQKAREEREAAEALNKAKRSEAGHKGAKTLKKNVEGGGTLGEPVVKMTAAEKKRLNDAKKQEAIQKMKETDQLERKRLDAEARAEAARIADEAEDPVVLSDAEGEVVTPEELAETGHAAYPAQTPQILVTTPKSKNTEPWQESRNIDGVEPSPRTAQSAPLGTTAIARAANSGARTTSNHIEQAAEACKTRANEKEKNGALKTAEEPREPVLLPPVVEVATASVSTAVRIVETGAGEEALATAQKETTTTKTTGRKRAGQAKKAATRKGNRKGKGRAVDAQNGEQTNRAQGQDRNAGDGSDFTSGLRTGIDGGFDKSTDQQSVAEHRIIDSTHAPAGAKIRIYKQRFWTIYGTDLRFGYPQIAGRHIQSFDYDPPGGGDYLELPDDGRYLDKDRLMRVSEYAREIFQFEPGRHSVSLPLRRNRRYLPGDYHKYDMDIKGVGFPAGPRNIKHLDPRWNCHLAYVREAAMRHIVDWLTRDENFPRGKAPRPIAVPETLYDKIHLYNAMQQLAMPKFLQRSLIEQLCIQIYQTPLFDCHLPDLEMTIGRLNSHTVSVVDPVLSCFTGLYGLREKEDRDIPYGLYGNDDNDDNENGDNARQQTREAGLPPAGPSTTGKRKLVSNSEDEQPAQKRPKPNPTISITSASASSSASEPLSAQLPLKYRTEYRELLADMPPEHPDDNGPPPPPEPYPDEDVIPPSLPILGHCIRHWSGVPEDDTKPTVAYERWPLQIGEMKYYNRPDAFQPEHPRSVRRCLRFQDWPDSHTVADWQLRADPRRRGEKRGVDVMAPTKVLRTAVGTRV